MNTHHDTPNSHLHTQTAIAIQLLRALARGSTIEDMERRLGLATSSVFRRLAALEAAGVRIKRPEGKGRRPPGRYRLADPELARAILAFIDPPM